MANEEKIIKKGTTVLLQWCHHCLGSEEEEEYTLDTDMTEKELNDMAYEMSLEIVQADGWYKLI